MLPYNGYHLECLRLGSRKGGAGMGCCAVDVFQNFNHDPDSKAGSEGFVGIENGDTNTKIMDLTANEQLGYGPTNKDVFLGYLRSGTFNQHDKMDKTFFAVLTKEQCNSSTGKKWLKILKENGFEFVRAVNNSVYNGGSKPRAKDAAPTGHAHVNYIFGLFRNISESGVKDPFAPPAGWDKLPAPEWLGDVWESGVYPKARPKSEITGKPKEEKVSKQVPIASVGQVAAGPA